MGIVHKWAGFTVLVHCTRVWYIPGGQGSQLKEPSVSAVHQGLVHTWWAGFTVEGAHSVGALH